MFEYRLQCDIWTDEGPDAYEGEYFDADSDEEALKVAESKCGGDWTTWKKTAAGYERTSTTSKYDNWMAVSRLTDT